MKTKSLFISTIAMVVMLIVALSVGTFAWYASQTNVDATGATVGALQTDESAIGIGFTNTSATASSVELGTTNIRPMIPTAKPDTVTSEGSLTFNEALLSTDENGDEIIADIKSRTPWTEKGVSSGTELWIGNLDTQKTVYVTPTVTIPNLALSDDLSPLLRISIFTKNGTTYTHLGTWGDGTAYACDMETAGEAGASLDGSSPSTIEAEGNKITLTAPGTPGTHFSIAGNGKQQIKVFAWLEGTLLTTVNMTNTAAVFDIEFASTLTNPNP
jgi:hypothetical protein